MAEIEFDKKIWNDSFYPLVFDQSRYLILRGGGGSGKSYAVVDKMIFRCLNEVGNRFLFVRAVKDTIRNSVYRLFKDRVYKHGLEKFFYFKDSVLEIIVKSTSTEIICVGMNDRERLKSLADPTSAWVEEATELTPHDWYQLNIRLRSGKGGYIQTIATFNPIDEGHWLKTEFFPEQIDSVLDRKYEERQKRRAKVRGWIKFRIDEVSALMRKRIKIKGRWVTINITTHISSYEDNRFLSEEYKAELELLKHQDYNYWQIYAKGRWGTVTGLVFNPTWRNKAFPKDYDELFYGIDFGYVHPNVLMMVAVKNGEYYVKELFYERGYTNKAFIEEVKEHNYIEGDDIIYADNHRPEYIQEWVDADFNVVPALKGNDSVEKGIDLLKSITIYTNKDNRNLNKELKLYKHKLDPKTKKPIEGEYVKLNDDCIAAVRYAIYSHKRQGEVKVAFIGTAA